jgi:hypothetical protein
MKLTEQEQETLIGFIGQWLDEVGDNNKADLEKIYNKLLQAIPEAEPEAIPEAKAIPEAEPEVKQAD